ncbi:hypothetical protein [Halovivax cerinus]|uniref:Uncharacterized protein n=1 Tax=Halovivax cerinus TaxID=1487865 RepID=A0ABD5NRN3_9EURY|nr:hypothetical protein [Halovivax cerinus]
MPNRSGLALTADERLRYRGDLRLGDEVAVTDDRLLVLRPDDRLSIGYDRIEEVSHEGFDWFLGLLSAALVAFGLYGLTRNPALGAFFVLAGLWSAHRSYRHRDRVRIHVRDEAKPVTVHPTAVEDCFAALESAIDAARDDVDAA